MKLNEVTVEGLKQAVRDSIRLGIPLFVFGTYGSGKTDIVNAGMRGESVEPISWIRGSHITPDVVAGVHYLDDGELRQSMPLIISACYKVVEAGRKPGLFMDELNLSTPNTLAALLQLLLEKRLGQYELPEGTPIIAAGNLDTDGSIVSQLPLPAANRMAIVHYTGPTFDEWAPWAAANGAHPVVMGFLRDNQDWLVARNMVEQGNNAIDPNSDRWPTPRSWMMASRHLHLLDDTGRKDERLSVLSRYVGDAAALRAEAYMAVADQLVPPEEVFANPMSAPLPDDGNLAAVYMNLTSLINALRGAEEVKPAMKAALLWSDRVAPAAMALLMDAVMQDEDMNKALFELVGEHGDELPDAAFDVFGVM